MLFIKDRIRVTPNTPEDAAIPPVANQHRDRVKRRLTGQGHEKIRECLSFFNKYNPTPIENALLLSQWLSNEKLCYYSRDDQVILKSFDIYRRSIIQKSIEDLWSLFTETSVFNALSGNVSDYYLDYDTSIEKLKNLLLFQCGDDYENFVNFLYIWFNRNCGKQNCLLIVGPPNSCKTLFSYILQDLSICCGQIANFNKFNQFSLQNCIDKQLLYWDEPNFEPGALETIKMLFAGDKCPANIKFKDHQIVYRTPVLITCNANPFPHNSAFNVRMQRYH